MRLKPKRRLILLASVAAGLAVVAFSAVVVRHWQRDRLTDRFLTEGLEAYKQGDYYTALGKTGSYLTRIRGDARRSSDPRLPDALLAYAESRRKIDEPNGSNYRDCLSFYQQYLPLRPNDRDTAITLLKTYNLCSKGVEAYKLAERLLPADGKYTAADLPVLREEALGYLTAGDNKSVESTFDKIIAISPLDVQGHSIFLASLERQQQRERARDVAKKLLDAHPNDPAAKLIAAISREISPTTNDVQEAVGWAREAGGLDKDSGAPSTSPVAYTDPEYIYRVVEVLDRFRQFDDSLAVLRLSLAKFNDVGLLRTYCRRLWQLHAPEELIQCTANQDASSLAPDADVLAFRALALLDAKRPADAAPIEAALAGRPGDFRARAWAKAIPLMDPARAPKQGVDAAEQWLDVLRINQNEAIFKCCLGEVYAALGRTDEARGLWKEAASYQPCASWPLPSYRIAQTYLAEGKPELAAGWSLAAVQISQNRLPEALLWIDAQAAAIQKGVPTAGGLTPAEVLKQIKTIDSGLQKGNLAPEAIRSINDRLLVPRVLLLARTGKPDEAKTAAIDALNLSPSLAPDVVQRLAATGQSENLGIQDECLKHLAGAESESALFAKAAQLADSGHPGDALGLLRDAVAKHPGNINLEASVPRLLEHLGDSTAAAEWARFGNAHPADLNVQRMCLQSSAAAGDPAFLKTAIERYVKLSGIDQENNEPLVVIARARALLQGAPSRTDRDKAISSLTVLISRSTDAPNEAKILLASALAMSGKDYSPDVPRAVAQLKDALGTDPGNPNIILQLATLLQAQGDYGGASQALQRILDAGNADPNARRMAAEKLIAQGDVSQRVADVLADVVRQAGDRARASTLVLLAEAYSTLHEGDASKIAELASPLYARIAAGAAAEIDANSIYLTARHFSLAGDQEKLAATLALLNGANADTATREFVLARLAVDHGRKDEAKAHFDAATAADPKREDIWSLYVSSTLKLNTDVGAAKEVAARAVAANPGSGQLAALSRQLATFAGGGTDIDLRALIDSLSADAGANADAIKACQDLLAAYTSNQFVGPDQISALADRFPQAVGIQLYAMNHLAVPAPARAATIAERTMAARPADPVPARAAAQLYLALNKFPQMLAVAEKWRRIDTTPSPEPDIAIAQACLSLGQIDRGLAALKPHLADALANPDHPLAPELLNMQARLLIADRKEDQAAAMLQPVLGKGERVRVQVVPGIIRDFAPTDRKMATRWLDMLRAAVSPSDSNGRLALGITCYTLGEVAANPAPTPESKKFTDEALSIFQSVTGDPATASADAFEFLGIVKQRTGDGPGAEECYRKAIEKNPKQSASLNNLACMAYQNRQFDKAVELAGRAVAAQPSVDNVDTLAQACMALGTQQLAHSPSEAKAVLQRSAEQYLLKARLSANSAPLIDAAAAYEKAGDIPRAVQILESTLRDPALDPVSGAIAKNNIAANLLRVNKSPTDLERARSLVDEAIAAITKTEKLQLVPAFLDTRGWVLLALQKYEQAEADFASAIDKCRDNNMLPATAQSSLIGRASALAHLGAARAGEASKILESIDPAELDEETRARYNSARAALKTLSENQRG